MAQSSAAQLWPCDRGWPTIGCLRDKNGATASIVHASTGKLHRTFATRVATTDLGTSDTGLP